MPAHKNQAAQGRRAKPKVSVVVVVYNIPREVPRTLLSLSAGYQRNIEADDYEVIVVDNGSNPPIDATMVQALPGNFRIVRLDPAPPSPAQAVNRGLAEARGEIVGVMIDGARIVTPGLLHFARHGTELYPRAVVATLGWYLGADFQRVAMLSGYDRSREDALLESIAWPADGYRLFEIATMDESSVDGWLAPISESNALFMRKELWQALGGMDERFDAPGGGLVNLDLFTRATAIPDSELVILLGEGTFHQFHGGIATNAHPVVMRRNWDQWAAQYEMLRGAKWDVPRLGKKPTYVGTLPPPALARFVRAAIDPLMWWEAPLGVGFDHKRWSATPAQPPADPIVAALIDLAQREFAAGRNDAAAAVARLTRRFAPDEPEPQRLLSLVSPWLQLSVPAEPSPEYYRALADAYRLLGQSALATANDRFAFALEQPDEAQIERAKAFVPEPRSIKTS